MELSSVGSGFFLADQSDGNDERCSGCCWILSGLFSQRVKEYLVGSSLVFKLQAKHDLLRIAVEKGITSAFLT